MNRVLGWGWLVPNIYQGSPRSHWRQKHQYLVDRQTTHTSSSSSSTTTTLHQSKYKYRHTMKITGLIASTMMLLAITVARVSYVSCSPRALAHTDLKCCSDYTSECEACKAGVTEEEICKQFATKYPRLGNCPNDTLPDPTCCSDESNLECVSCLADLSEEEYCKKNPDFLDCPTKAAGNGDCWSSYWTKKNPLVHQKNSLKLSARGSFC